MSAGIGDLGALLGTGRSSHVHVWPEDEALVVKLYFADYPAELIDAEEIVCGEVSRMGVKTVRCHGRVEVGDRTGLLFDRVAGESLTRLAQRNPLRARSTARTLARTHADLHQASTDLPTDVRETAIAALDTPPLAFLDEVQRERAHARIAALPAGDRIVHLDCHTDNVFVHEAGHAIIDWQTARRGDPAADVAATVVLFRDAELWPGTPLVDRVMIGLVRRAMLSSYLSEYRRLTGMTRAQIDAWRLVAVVLRMSTLDVASERDGFRRELRRLLGGEG